MVDNIAPPNSQDLEAQLEKKIAEARANSVDREYQVLAEKHKLSFSDLKSTPISTEALTLITEQESRNAAIAIIYKLKDRLLVAVTDPENPNTAQILGSLREKGYELKLILTTPAGLEIAWHKYKSAPIQTSVEIGSISLDETELEQIEKEIKNLSDLRNKISSITITKMLEIIVAGALKTQASDIHFEPEESKDTRIRYRLDGYLQDIAAIEKTSYEKLVNRIKVLSKLTLNVHQKPQDGRFTIREKNIDIEVRVSILPSEYGETIVMRLLDPRTIRQNLEDLGMRQDVLDLVKKQLSKATGTILTTGPTGSGKTTSLYAFVNYLNATDTKIITVEDPIEYHIKGISQTQVEPERGYTFANGLRAIVRQDPDVILVGEIRDLETADIALQAALTGHIVLSTLHTNDAAGTVPRLVDLGIKPQTIVPAISLAMAQRLLRVLCEKCKKEQPISAVTLDKIKASLEPIKEKFKLTLDENLKEFVPVGCEACNGAGFKGRVGVYEAFTISREMEKVILSGAPVSEVRDVAIKDGMITMFQDAYLKILSGVTAMEEVERVLGTQ